VSGSRFVDSSGSIENAELLELFVQYETAPTAKEGLGLLPFLEFIDPDFGFLNDAELALAFHRVGSFNDWDRDVIIDCQSTVAFLVSLPIVTDYEVHFGAVGGVKSRVLCDGSDKSFPAMEGGLMLLSVGNCDPPPTTSRSPTASQTPTPSLSPSPVLILSPIFSLSWFASESGTFHRSESAVTQTSSMASSNFLSHSFPWASTGQLLIPSSDFGASSDRPLHSVSMIESIGESVSGIGNASPLFISSDILFSTQHFLPSSSFLSSPEFNWTITFHNTKNDWIAEDYRRTVSFEDSHLRPESWGVSDSSPFTSSHSIDHTIFAAAVGVASSESLLASHPLTSFDSIDHSTFAATNLVKPSHFLFVSPPCTYSASFNHPIFTATNIVITSNLSPLGSSSLSSLTGSLSRTLTVSASKSVTVSLLEVTLVSLAVVPVTSYSVTQSFKDLSFIPVCSMSQTVFIVSSLTYMLFDVIVYVPSASHVPVAATLGQTPLVQSRMSNSILIGIVSGAAAVACIIAGAIVFVIRTKMKENASSGDGKPAGLAECHCEDSSETTDEPASHLGIDQRFSYDQTILTYDITQLAESDEPLFV
jgi:hypothetical protein